MRYLVVGDCHGNLGNLYNIIESANKKYKIDACIQVGDFGFYPLVMDKYKFLKFPIPVYAIDGNHENHEWLMKCINSKSHIEWIDKNNINFISRGSVWDIEGCKIGFMGGAMNVHRSQEGSTSKGTTNYPTNNQIKEAIEKFNSVGGVNIMITHSCPHSIGVGMVGDPFFLKSIEKNITRPFMVSTGNINDCGEETLLNLWNGLVEKPKHWIFGHFHQTVQRKVLETYFTCVGSADVSDDKMYCLPFILDTEKKDLECYPSSPLLKARKQNSNFNINPYLV